MWDVNSGQLSRAILAPELTVGSPKTFTVTTSQLNFGPVLLFSVLYKYRPKDRPNILLRSMSPSWS